MPEYRLTDFERYALLIAALRVSSMHDHMPSDLINAIRKIEGTDTVLTASRAYPPNVVLADDN